MSNLGESVYEDIVARGKSLSTAKEWRSNVERFVVVCGEKAVYERSDVIKFVAWMRKEGYKQTTIELKLRSIKLVSKIQSWSEFPVLSMKKIDVEDITRTTFTREELLYLIERIKVVGSPSEKAALALASVYGFRREELGSLELNRVVKVKTLKGGKTVEHGIPDNLREYLAGYRSAGVTYYTKVFRKIISKVYGKRMPGYGWHSIRRTLATELVLQNASVINIIRFMRWSDASFRGELGMLAIYAKKDRAKIDEEIFKIHPFVNSW